MNATGMLRTSNILVVLALKTSDKQQRGRLFSARLAKDIVNQFLRFGIVSHNELP